MEGATTLRPTGEALAINLEVSIAFRSARRLRNQASVVEALLGRRVTTVRGNTP
jgi:hypothetical protein